MESITKREQAAIEARRKYHRQWRAKNKDKVKQYNQDYWYRKSLQEDFEKTSDEGNREVS